MITGITHVTLYVRDEEEALRFYRDALGFELRMDAAMGPGRRWLTVGVPGQTELELVLLDPHAWYPPADADAAMAQVGHQPMLVLSTNDIESDYTRLRAAGVHLDTPIHEVPWGREFVLADLYGNRINLVQSTHYLP